MSSRSQVMYEVIVRTLQGGGSVSQVMIERSHDGPTFEANGL